jgi:hypothetical protein
VDLVERALRGETFKPSLRGLELGATSATCG